MTRYNNVGMKKRKYVQATQFGEEEPVAGPSRAASPPAHDAPASNEQPAAEPAKKKRKRGKPRKPQPSGDGGADGAEASGEQGEEKETQGKKKPTTKAEKGKKKLKEKRGECSTRAAVRCLHALCAGADARKFASERRRLQRQDERHANTTCFACREQGHAAKNCPKALAADGGAGKSKLGKQVVGICYRYVIAFV